jgi:site-specific recombinase XerD
MIGASDLSSDVGKVARNDLRRAPSREIDIYVTHLEAEGKSEATVAQVAYVLRRLRRFLGQPLREATRAELVDFVNSLSSLAPATRTSILSYVARYYAWLERTGQILMSPARGLPSPHLEREVDPRKVLSESDVARLLRAPDETTPVGLRDRAILEVLYGAGLRRQELVGLDLTDWLVGEGLLHVRRGKRRKERLVPLGRHASRALGTYLRRARTLLVGDRMTPALFVGVGGARLGVQSITDLVRRHGLRALSRRVSPHRLRHSFATHLLRGGAGVRAVQLLLGHASVESTERYTHLVVDDLHAALRLHPREAASGVG